jgi:putative copper resistance protein D
MSDALILVRAVHLLATILLTGAVVFHVLVAEPALGGTGESLLARLRAAVWWLAAINLGIAVASGAAWLALLVASLGEASIAEFGERAWIFLTQTQFGITAQLRLAIALLLAAALLARRRDWHETALPRAIVLGASAAFAGTLAWSGHGGATPGGAGAIHGAADALHLIAAAAWIGGLVPLALLLRWALRAERLDPAALTEVLRRFSNLGMLAVATLLASGAVNTIFSVASLDALVASAYGRLLLLKIALFAGMAALAALNRLTWMPGLAAATSDTAAQPIARIHANALGEIALGIAIVLLVAWLGTMAPAMPPQGHFH